jgi:CMP-N,N'-diacetyllegionaminic acid synthase
MAAESLLIVIPARGGSHRLPGKNLRSLAGKTLIGRTVDIILESGLKCSSLLSTDDSQIAEQGRLLGLPVPFVRPAHLSGATAKTEDAVLHALDWFRDDSRADPEFLMVLQVTSPLRPSGILRRSIKVLELDEHWDAVVGMKAIHVGSRFVFREMANRSLERLAPVTVPERLLVPNGTLYLIRTTVFRRLGTLLPPRTYPLVMDEIASIDIDTQADWDLAEAAIRADLTGAVT